MQKSQESPNYGVGILGLIILGITVWFLFHEFSQAPWQFITAMVALIGSLLAVLGTYSSNLAIQIRNEQKPQKTEVYDKLMRIFFDVLLEKKLGLTSKSQEEITCELASITPNLILWASDEVLAEFINFRQTAALYADNPDRNPIMPFAKLMLAMRKDFGHKNNGVDENLVLASFINDIKLID